MDRTLDSTFYIQFTTRAFATGIPTLLAGTPVISAYEDGSLTQITAGITLGVDHDSVSGLNLVTIVATTANGFELGKDYNLVITTGTVDSVSVVGEVVGAFSIGLSAAAVDLANATDGLGALSAFIADVPTVAEFDARTLVAASYFDPAADTVTLAAATHTGAVIPTVSVLTGHTVQTADHTAVIAAVKADTAATLIDTNELQINQGAWATATGFATEAKQDAQDAIITETRLSELDAATAGKVANQIDIIQTDTTTDIPALITALNDVAATDIVSGGAINTTGGAVDTTTTNTDMRGTDSAVLATTVGTAGAGLTDLGGMSTAMKAEVNVEADTALTDYDGPTNAEMIARTPTAAQLAYIVSNAATGMAVVFTTAGGATTTAVINTVDGAAASATNDQYNGRLLVFTDGTLKGVVTDITDYVGATTTATITAIPFAPTATHNARLI